MKRSGYLIALVFMLFAFSATAQNEEAEKTGGFKKENLFTGGSVSLGIGGNSFQAGASPVLGYSLAPWADAGISINYNYASYRNVSFNNPNDKLRSSTYGGGAFTRLYPVSFAFAQIQFEHNFINQKLISGDGSASVKNREEANSLLLGVGYATGRYPGGGQPFFYLSLLFDVLDNEFSPYVRNGGGILPILRGGLQVPLFQGRKRAPIY
ncbi:MAG: hypothetical protein H0X41_04500 [Chitinophagaceae bacterium]|nr:hypothetical protein [Chitinophagaceae bacterium]